MGSGMTKDELIRMAEEAGFYLDMWQLSFGCEAKGSHEELERFAALVAKHERQRICKQIAQLHDALSMASNPLITPRGSLGEEV